VAADSGGAGHPGSRLLNAIIVTADDLGISPGVTRGVLESHRDGVVRSTSLLVTFPDSAEGAALARAEQGLEIGLHVDLVGGRPVSDPARVPSLVDGEGRFHRLADFTARLFTGRIRTAELALEIRGQTARAREWGIEPRAWDSHQHTHLMPPLARVVARIARDEGVRYLRRASGPRLTAPLKAQLLAAATLADRFLLRGIPGNDWFVDLSALPFRPDAAGVALYAAYRGVGEIIAHPGYPDDALRATGDGLVLQRHDDLMVLRDPLLRSALGDTVRWRVR
jgi:predicted glycoside hydrolase/deacetylase ChbG (UPF0249 family)